MRLFDKKRQPLAMLAKQRRAKLADVVVKIFPLAGFPLVNKSLRSRRIIKIEDRRLNKSVGRACAGRVQWIALKLDWASVHRHGNQRNAPGTARHCSGVIEEFTRNGPFYIFGKRNQM